MKALIPYLAGCSFFVLLMSFSTQDEKDRLSIVKAATEFLQSLSSQLREDAVLPLDDDDRTDWNYLPGRRPGVRLKDMNQQQRDAAHNLLRSALSARGYEKTTEIIALEDILSEIENNSSRDPELYYFTVFGTPSVAQPWGWRVEGHHLSLNFTLEGDDSPSQLRISTTPAFMGSNPATIPSGSQRGHRILAKEEDIAFELLHSLTQEQRAQAITATSAPRDIITGGGRKASLEKFEGIKYAALNSQQQNLLTRLVDEYINNMRDDIALKQREKIERSGLENIYFAWAGYTQPNMPHYYRVHGPTFLIELDNTQNNANHIHSVWRDLEDDFGEDLLRRHYEQSPHHKQ
ncbi:MAG: DUF3500 domain-containing protein [Ignavibacteriae bacterium]|nr:DUF3500 domain-containing protein [Ignavibacteriota bacterium]